MHWWEIDDLIFFEKIRRKKLKSFPKFSLEEQELLNSQRFGSIHNVNESKIKIFRSKDPFFQKERPGVVITPPQEPSYETEWIPMSSKIYNRDPDKVVFLPKWRERVMVDSVILLDYRRWFKFKTLSHKKGELSEGKKIELQNKLRRLKKLENHS